MNLPRRQFLKTSLMLGTALSLADFETLFGQTASPTQPPTTGAYHLAAVRNGSRRQMLDAAMEALGGMKSFVKTGHRVLVKPNIGWDVPPERGANTHPDIVARLVEMALAAGAAEVLVCDNSCDEWRRAYTNSGIEAAVIKAGGKMVNGKDPSHYREFSNDKATRLKACKVHELLLDADVVINAPTLKHHSGARMTAAMKNLMGSVWDRGFYHKNDLQRCIAEFLYIRKPTLNVIDAYHPMIQNGPRGKSVEDLSEMKSLLVSTDIVAIDAAAAKLLGYDPASIGHIKIASELGFGRMDLANMNIARISI